MIHTKWRKRVLVVLIAQCQHLSPCTPVSIKQECKPNKLIDCIVYVWFSGEGGVCYRGAFNTNLSAQGGVNKIGGVH